MRHIDDIAAKVRRAERIDDAEAARLWREAPLWLLGELATAAKQRVSGDKVYYNRNFHIEPTNRCVFNCRFCSYRRPAGDPEAWDYTMDEIEQIARERQGKGITEVHIVGGVHPDHGLDYYTDMIRQRGMLPGLSAHMPELIVYSDLNEYDVETYIQLYNCMGFLMQVEIEYVHKIIWSAKKPVMTIKPMAAGRCSPFVGITFSFATLRPCDMVTVGAASVEEVHEDVEIALAALERRPPDVEGRNSPAKSSIMK